MTCSFTEGPVGWTTYTSSPRTLATPGRSSPSGKRSTWHAVNAHPSTEATSAAKDRCAVPATIRMLIDSLTDPLVARHVIIRGSGTESRQRRAVAFGARPSAVPLALSVRGSGASVTGEPTSPLHL